ncbi:MAG: class I SAM-dependent methyltransferase [Lachnospiraceae bacterium]
MLDTMEMKRLLEILEEQPNKIVLSNSADKTYLYKKVVVRKVILKQNEMYQMERFTQKQAFHENIMPENLVDSVIALFPNVYRQMNIFCEDRQIDLKVTKKGKLLFHQQKEKNPTSGKRITVDASPVNSNNRKKRYILQEGSMIPPLVDLGIFTKDGKIVRSMYDKYKQINRFLELVEDVVKDYPNKAMHIIDFGCGKSYLTFILYYYLVEVKKYPVHITGLDLKEEVILHCNETAKKYGYKNLHFEVGDINGYQTEEPVDMVVTLHACDTATDYALYNAICWKSSIILSVPCCQKEVNRQIQSDDFSLLTRYGIVKERMSALMTDAIRGNALIYCGYKTQLLEFVDFASSPKNVLIRAVKSTVSDEKKECAKKEILSILKEFHLKHTLVDLLEIDKKI